MGAPCGGGQLRRAPAGVLTPYTFELRSFEIFNNAMATSEALQRLARPFNKSGARIDPVYRGAVGVLGINGTGDPFDNRSGHQCPSAKQLAAEKHWMHKTSAHAAANSAALASGASQPSSASSPPGHDDYCASVMPNGFARPGTRLPAYLDDGNDWRLDTWREMQASYKADRARRADYDGSLTRGGGGAGGGGGGGGGGALAAGSARGRGGAASSRGPASGRSWSEGLAEGAGTERSNRSSCSTLVLSSRSSGSSAGSSRDSSRGSSRGRR